VYTAKDPRVTGLGLAESTSKVAWSSDGGLTWSPLAKALYGDGSLTLPNGDQLFMPYYLRPAGGGAMGAPYQRCPKGQRTLEVVKPGVVIEGWPRPDKSFAPELGLSGFVSNGQIVSLDDESYLATLYGYFRETSRYSLVASVSSDGVRWRIRSVIADEKCELPGREGPCESAIARLKDGRLLCVFRLNSGVPYGHSFSSDEGRTWSKPAALEDAFSVQPSLAVMPDGLVALSGGRPGLFLWLNPDGTAATWHKLDVLANHNAHRPEEPIKAAGNTSSYTEVLPLDDSHLLYIYDRIPFGWDPIPPDSPETNSVWVVRVTLSRPFGCPTPDDIQGSVVDDDGPVADAVVRIQATPHVTKTDSKGRFRLSAAGLDGAPFQLTAWASGYFCGGPVAARPGQQDVELPLRRHHQEDHATYRWCSFKHRAGEAEDQGCSACHTRQGTDLAYALPVDQWLLDAHSQSAVNPRFLTMYAGTDMRGNQSPPIRYAANPDYGPIPLAPDASKPYYGSGYKLDWPHSAGNCACCHTLVAAVNAPYGTDPRESDSSS